MSRMKKWYLIYEYHDTFVSEFYSKDELYRYLEQLKETYKYDSDFRYRIIYGEEETDRG